MRLRSYLIVIFLALALVPVAILRIWPNSAVLQTEFDDAQERHLLLAQNLAAALAQYHRNVSNTFKLMITTPAVWGTSDQVSATLADLGFRHLCIADAASGQLLNQVARADMACPDRVSPNLLEEFNATATQEVVFSAVKEAPDRTNILYMMSALSGGRIAFGALSTAYFVELGRAISFGKRGHATIVDHAGNVLFHPLPDWIAARKNIKMVSAVERMMNGETGVEVFYSPALKRDMIAGFTSVRPVGWGVMIPQPIEELHDKAAFAKNSSAIALLFGLAGALFLAFIVSVFSSRPIEQISSAARQIANGELFDPSTLTTNRYMPREIRNLHQSFRDMIGGLRRSMARINTLAFTDSLTNLPNRESFRRYLVKHTDKTIEGPSTLMFVDLDGFKSINDTKGHDAGDAVLKEVARRICAALNVPLRGASSQANAFTPRLQTSGPMVARLGGDEFAVFLPHDPAQAGAKTAADILRALAPPVAIGTQKARIGASIGIAQFPEDGSNFSDLLKAADLAMYEAKRAGKNQAQRYTSDLAKSYDALTRLAPELAEGFAQGQFDVHFQPVYDAQTYAIVSAEALLRWHHPTMGLLEAENFIAAAARFGFQRQIDLFAIEQSLAIVTDMKIRGTALPALSLNIWSDCLLDPDFVELIIQQLTRFPCPISIELVSCDTRQDARIIWALDRIREAGIGVAIDDFGSGRTSLSALTDLRPSVIKIDQKITSRVHRHANCTRLVGSIIEMAHAQGIQVTAEGIETLDQIKALQSLGCDTIQGYALNSPLSRDELTYCLATNLTASTRSDQSR
ncbi:MAG: EAL domain-containing protein [Silicimonas sp.]|nr:EAL domain-containing protein [Silicimonas sp.]